MTSSKAKDVFGLNTIKQYKNIFAFPVAHVINMSTRQARVPSTWKIAKVTPVLQCFPDKSVLKLTI